MKLTKGKIIAGVLILCALAAAFFLPELGGAGSPPSPAATDAPSGTSAQTPAPGETSTQTEAPAQEKTPAPTQEGTSAPAQPPAQTEAPTQTPVQTGPPATEPPATDPPTTDPPATEDDGLTCTLSISCATILDNMDLLTPGKESLVPADGWLLKPVAVPFTEGESVFDVLSRELKSRDMHFEYHSATLYDASYIEGICNLYEYDCGELSGWEYSVNGLFPSYGCGQFTLSDGDEVALLYTCDLGADVGDEA